MLPSKGYFHDIECPYLENNCGRPYCHFNHRKKQQDNSDEVSLEQCNSKDIPTYKPTPKSELAVRRSHIPISYVPDVYKVDKSTTRSFRSNATSDIVYKPTPISLLNSAVKSSVNSDNTNSLNIENSSSETKYNPECRMKDISENLIIINENQEKYEYKPAEPSVEYKYNPTSYKDFNEESLVDIVYKPNSSGLNDIPNVKYTPSSCSKQNSSIDFVNLDNEFEMIDEIINTSAISKKSKTLSAKKITSFQSNSANKSSFEKVPQKIIDELDYFCDKNDQLVKENNHKNREKDLNPKENSRHDKKDRKTNDKEKHKEKKDKYDETCKKKKKGRDEKEIIEKRSESKTKNSKTIDKGESSRSRDKDKKNHDKSCREEKKEPSRHINSEVDKDFNRKKYKDSQDKKRDSRTHSSRKERDKDKHSKCKTESYESDKKQDRLHSKHEGDKKKESSKPKSELEKTNIVKKIMDEPEYKNSSNYEFDIDIDMDEQQTMEECFKIFNEYKPTDAQPIENENISVENESGSVEETTLTKKRIAHSNALNSVSKFQPPKPMQKLTPGQVMNNRFKIIKDAQANNEEKLISRELKAIVKRPKPSELLKPSKKIKLSEMKPLFPTSSSALIDEIMCRTNSKTHTKKIAPVSNVMNMQKAKANLNTLNKQTTEEFSKTIAQTYKTGKRQAHIPDYSLNDIPDVLDMDKSKLPVNVRSRFLTLLAEECCKLYLVQKDAYKRALDEEYSCYQKCKVLLTYRNSAMLAVNRLRKELKEREEKNLGPIGSEESGQVKQEDAEKKVLYNKIHQYTLTDEELDIHGYPKESKVAGKAIIKNRKNPSAIPLPKNQKKCCRCSKIYLINDEGKAIYEEECLYHPLKKRTIRGEHIYLCCKSTDDSGCVTSHAHVSETPDDAELEGFQTTLPPNSDKDPRSYAIYALDCEMCYTTKGLELTRVTVIDTNCKTVYESLVKPLNDIIDYNTRFSGITKQQMDKTSTGILQVQANILHLCNSKTILIGHSLESDMKALKIIHGTIVDTAVLFPHKMGLPHKRALRTLASDYLKKIIQNDVGGHDSAEDAITCMELIKWKVKEDTKFRS